MIDLSSLDMDIWIPILITVLGFVSYFFGKLISETLPTLEDGPQNYIYGFFFILVYLILPISAIYYFHELFLFNLGIVWAVLFFLGLLIIRKYMNIKKNVYEVHKGQAYDYFEKESFKITNAITSKFGNGWPKKSSSWAFTHLFTRLPSKATLVILTYIEVFLVSNLIYSSNLVLGVIFFILLITSMANTAVLTVASGINYRAVELKDINNNLYRGNILKYSPEFISIRDKRKVYNFPRENVLYVQAVEELPVFLKDEPKETTKNPAPQQIKEETKQEVKKE